MATIDGRTWLEHMNPDECWRMLAGTPVGRIGVLNDSAPEIYPVNHAVDQQTIVFRTDPGSKLRGLLRSPAVCYQVDHIDPAEATGWSVLVKGRAVEVRDVDELRAVAALRIDYWTLGDKAHWVRIVPVEVTGRRIWNRTTKGAGGSVAMSEAARADANTEPNEEASNGNPPNRP
jgi:nitroimidazol reductase NimA-like FMN-containing flavoprotein (pyridoxamine 5'-phosphate oxidase superfamily)